MRITLFPFPIFKLCWGFVFKFFQYFSSIFICRISQLILLILFDFPSSFFIFLSLCCQILDICQFFYKAICLFVRRKDVPMENLSESQLSLGVPVEVPESQARAAGWTQ